MLLTPKERECLRLVAENHSSKKIARRLSISQSSVDTHLRRARAKLGVSDRLSAARLLISWEEGRCRHSDPALPRPPSGLAWPRLADVGLAGRLVMVVAGSVSSAFVFGLLLSALAAL
jgi:DNA-binding CsgD family transcriptional regulator